MASTSFKSLAAATVFMVVAIFASAVSAQDLGELTPAPAPAPSMENGATYSLGMSGALICSSLLLSMLALLKN